MGAADRRDYWVDDTLTLPLPVLDGRPGLRLRQMPGPPRPAPEHEPDNRNLVSRVLSALRDPEYRGSYALVANTIATSAIGAGYWAVAAHLLSPENLGRATSLISALMLVATLSQLNLSSIMMRFLPQMGSRTAGRLVNISYLVTTLTALVGSAIFVLVLPRISSEWSFIGGSSFFMIIFAVSVVVWEIFTLQDAALIGLQRAGVVPVENVIYSLAKLALLVIAVRILGSTDVLFSWMIPLIVLIPVINWMIFRCLRERSPQDLAPGLGFRRLARFASVDFAGVIFGQVTGNVLPLLVISILGPDAAGAFYIVSLITSGVASVGINFATGMMVEAAAAPSRLPELTRGALKRCCITMVPATVVLVVGAHFILKIYGGSYVANTTTRLFQMLSLGLLPFCIETVAYSLDRIEGKPIRATLSQLAIAVITLGGSWALFGRFGINGVGIATLVAGIAVALVRLPTVVAALQGRAKVAAHPARAAGAAQTANPGQPVKPAQPGREARLGGPAGRRVQPPARPVRRAHQGWPADPPTQPIRRAPQSASTDQPGRGAQPAARPGRPAAQQPGRPAAPAQPAPLAITRPQPSIADQPGRPAQPAWRPQPTFHPATPARPAAQPGRGAQPASGTPRANGAQPALGPQPANGAHRAESTWGPQPAGGAQPAAAPEERDPAPPRKSSAGRTYAGRHRSASPPVEAEQPGDGRSQPRNGGIQPENGRSQPENGRNQPENGRSQPRDGNEQPGDGRKQPADDGRNLRPTR
jgi:O-antigen/teichoic acid export membrane protein